MEQVRLGRSNLEVSRIAFGTWELGGDWGATDDQAAIAAIRHAADQGINLFDTAHGYGFGASEHVLGKALQGRPRDQVVIATKGGLRPDPKRRVQRDASPDWVRRGVDESLDALGTDYIDLFQLHWPDPGTPYAETAGAVADLVAAGKIRHFGVSNFDAGQLEEFSRVMQVETLQPPYDLFRRDIEASVLPYARARDIGVLVYGALAHGLLSGAMTEETRFAPHDWRSRSDDFTGEAFHRNLSVVRALQRFAERGRGVTVSQLAIAWTLANPAVHVTIVGTRNPRHVDDTIRAADLVLDEQAMRRIDDIVRAEVPVAGPSPETV